MATAWLDIFRRNLSWLSPPTGTPSPVVRRPVRTAEAHIRRQRPTDDIIRRQRQSDSVIRRP